MRTFAEIVSFENESLVQMEAHAVPFQSVGTRKLSASRGNLFIREIFHWNTLFNLSFQPVKLKNVARSISSLEVHSGANPLEVSIFNRIPTTSEV